jgi:hypothetical protein
LTDVNAMNSATKFNFDYSGSETAGVGSNRAARFFDPPKPAGPDGSGDRTSQMLEQLTTSDKFAFRAWPKPLAPLPQVVLICRDLL